VHGPVFDSRGRRASPARAQPGPGTAPARHGQGDRGATAYIGNEGEDFPLPPGATTTFCDRVSAPHAGDWQAGAEFCRRWLATWYRPRNSQDKAWFRRAAWIRSHIASATIARQVSRTPAIFGAATGRWRLGEFLAADRALLSTDPSIVHFYVWAFDDAQRGDTLQRPLPSCARPCPCGTRPGGCLLSRRLERQATRPSAPQRPGRPGPRSPAAGGRLHRTDHRVKGERPRRPDRRRRPWPRCGRPPGPRASRGASRDGARCFLSPPDAASRRWSPVALPLAAPGGARRSRAPGPRGASPPASRVRGKGDRQRGVREGSGPEPGGSRVVRAPRVSACTRGSTRGPGAGLCRAGTDRPSARHAGPDRYRARAAAAHAYWQPPGATPPRWQWSRPGGGVVATVGASRWQAPDRTARRPPRARRRS
jgi:hypothetical protein